MKKTNKPTRTSESFKSSSKRPYQSTTRNTSNNYPSRNKSSDTNGNYRHTSNDGIKYRSDYQPENSNMQGKSRRDKKNSNRQTNPSQHSPEKQKNANNRYGKNQANYRSDRNKIASDKSLEKSLDKPYKKPHKKPYKRAKNWNKERPNDSSNVLKNKNRKQRLKSPKPVRKKETFNKTVCTIPEEKRYTLGLSDQELAGSSSHGLQFLEGMKGMDNMAKNLNPKNPTESNSSNGYSSNNLSSSSSTGSSDTEERKYKFINNELNELDVYDCYENDEYEFTELDFSNKHTIQANHPSFKKILTQLKKDFYLKPDNKYAIVYVYTNNKTFLHNVIASYKLHKVDGIRFLNSNKEIESTVIFSKEEGNSCADVYIKNVRQEPYLVFKSFDDIPSIKSTLKSIYPKWPVNENVLIDRLIRHNILSADFPDDIDTPRTALKKIRGSVVSWSISQKK